ncbi:lantibiotic dehydratase [Streptomyces griseocarneus]|uniref:lantibiotic dehydratase n=1 Tax=Streptomyces griseocarneus TaxID=51201 RepID=UPI00167E1FB3|nr:lantibiotic dehydratase [Streptomyces griseocarneus]MBZ6475186.1 lantibiotic dehydratase family protein [Streptomyces griseocarneus]GHG61768.1 hypothetical protein GCM10018779_29940 [Streptomyces griseocarneus]
MPYSAGADPVGHPVRSAPHALARATVLAHPAQSPAAAEFRASLARLSALDGELLHLTGPLCDDLYAGRDGHPAAFHRDVVLPLRRALHNGRAPRPAVLDRLGDLPARVPRLATWLALRERRDALLAELDRAAGPALAAERTALAALCREPALARAVALTSTDLLRAVQRAGTGADDRRARKEEPNVLRYALRASTKTSPLSWFTAVGWGPLRHAPASHRRVPSWGEADLFDGPLTSTVKVNRTLTAALTAALLDAPHRRAALPHRITSTARVADGRAAYSRGRVAFAGGRYLVVDEDEAELAASGPLRLVTERAETPVGLDELTDALASALSGADNGRAPARAFLDRLVHAGLLVPVDPVGPQEDDPLGRLAAWLRTLGTPHGEVHAAEHDQEQEQEQEQDEHDHDHDHDRALAGRLDEISRLTAGFGAAPAAERPALLAGLARRWSALLADAGRAVPAGSAPLNVLSEDVVAPGPLRLDGFLDGADHEALGEVTALAELFDLGHLMRRVVRDRFVERYGPGGRCRHPWEFGADVAEAWETAGRLAALAPADRARFPTGAAEQAALRQELADAVRDAVTEDGPATGDNVVLPPDLVKGLGERLPRWALERPVSYAYFLQRDPAAGMLCVNRVYGGWGRFTSRFLDALDPSAAEAVAGQIRRGLGEGARAAQIRPVGGFNANLHPLLVPDELGPDRHAASIGEADVELVHDEATDQVRLRLLSTGELLDVLYPGFLAPIMLPRRIGAALGDQPHGVVDFGSLVPRSTVPAPGGQVVRTPRLRHRHVVLRRRRWLLPPGVAGALRAELAAAQEVPAQATARWRALLGLPEQVFLHPVATAPTGRAAEDFLTHLRRPKPQFVDLGNALHLRCLAKWLARHPDGVVLEEALPAPGGLAAPARAVELVLETYRAGRPR